MYAHDLWGDFASNCKVKADKSRCMFYIENESSFMLLKNNGMIALSLFIVDVETSLFYVCVSKSYVSLNINICGSIFSVYWICR